MVVIFALLRASCSSREQSEKGTHPNRRYLGIGSFSSRHPRPTATREHPSHTISGISDLACMNPFRLHTAPSLSVVLRGTTVLRQTRSSVPLQAVLTKRWPRPEGMASRDFSMSAGAADPGSTRSSGARSINKNLQAQARSSQVSHHLSASSSTPTSTFASSYSTQAKGTMAQTSLPSRGGYDPKAASVYTPRKIGAPHTLEHRIYIEKDGVPVSPFHDIPLYANEQQTVLNMVVEIPRWTNAKQEVRSLIADTTTTQSPPP